MKTAILKRLGSASAARWLGLLAVAGLLLGAVSSRAQASKTQTTVTTLGGGPQYYNPGNNFGSSNSVYGTLYSQFHTPSGLAIDNSLKYLYVADRDNNAIRLIDLSDPANPSETYAFVPYPPYVPTNLISQPVGVAVDALGNVYVLNRGKGTNGTVVEFDSFGDLIATNTTRLTNASAIALDPAGNIFVTTSNTVFKITSGGASNVVATITNAGVSLQGIVLKRIGPSAGLLAVCDSGRNGIYFVDPTSGAVSTNVGFNGIGDYTGNRNQGVLNADVQFFQPTGIAEAGDGSLIVAVSGTNRVKVVSATGITTNLYGVATNLWWTGQTQSGGTAYLGWSDGNVYQPDTSGDVQGRVPYAVTIGSDGTVYTTELFYHTIRKVTDANITPPPPFPPPPPFTVTAVAGYGQVFLNWSTSLGATNYNIKRSTTNNAETFIANTGNTSYTDMSVLDGVTYYYRISASNTGGEGLNSGEVSAMPLFSPAPTNLIVTTTNFGSISLSWSPSLGATGYNLKRAPSHGGPYNTIVATNISGTSFTDTTVVNGTPYFYVVTAVNPGGENPTNSPEASATPPLPPVTDPVIGWVTFPPPLFTSVLNVGTPSGNTFNNDVPIVIKFQPGTQAFYTYTNTTIFTNFPDPTSGDNSAPQGYTDGLGSIAGLTVAQILPDLAIKAIGEQTNHPNSAIVSALFSFQVGNPGIFGTNAAQFTVSNITFAAQMFYTIDGSDPTNDGSSLGPVSNGQILSLNMTSSNLLFKVRGFKPNYHPSAISSNLFLAASFVPNIISFGFASGEASSDFVASPGQTFYAPVTLSILPGTLMYSLQFNLTVYPGPTNPGPALASPPAPFSFQSMLMKPIPGTSPVLYTNIPTYMFVNGGFTNLSFTNLSANLLGVGWVERIGATNLYNTASQDLIQFSLAHDDLFLQSGGKIIVGGYSVNVPAAAAPGQTYQITIGRPSATSDGVGAPGSSVLILAPTNGSLGGGAPLNATKYVTLGNRKYIAGNSYPFRWFNAGDFGNTNLQNADVEQVFQSAIYALNFPPPGSDFFDAMDSCGDTYVDNGYGYLQDSGVPASTAALFDGNDTTINNIAFGDGVLDVCDVYVTYRRSLDTNLVWFARFWTNDTVHAVSGRVAQIVPNVFNPSVVKQTTGGKTQPGVVSNAATNTPSVNFTAGDFLATAGQQILIPITATVFGNYPLRVAMLNISVVPLDGSPALTTPISFSPGAALGTPYTTASDGNGNYAAAWLNSTIAGISNNGTIGTLTVTIPANATSASAYAVHFDHASGSPNGLASFTKQTWTGLITLSSRNTSSYNDSIPDSWRLRWFGTIYNLLSVSNACPSCDGVNNWKKYVAGVDPNTPNDFPSLNTKTPVPAGAKAAIHWPTVNGKQYVILSSGTLFPGSWTTNATVTGTGGDMEYNDNSGGAVKFYRVLILP